MQQVLINIIEKAQIEKKITTESIAKEITSDLFIIARGVIYDWCLHNGKYDLQKSMKKFISIMVDSIAVKPF